MPYTIKDIKTLQSIAEIAYLNAPYNPNPKAVVVTLTVDAVNGVGGTFIVRMMKHRSKALKLINPLIESGRVLDAVIFDFQKLPYIKHTIISSSDDQLSAYAGTNEN